MKAEVIRQEPECQTDPRLSLLPLRSSALRFWYRSSDDRATLSELLSIRGDVPMRRSISGIIDINQQTITLKPLFTMAIKLEPMRECHFHKTEMAHHQELWGLELAYTEAVAQYSDATIALENFRTAGSLAECKVAYRVAIEARYRCEKARLALEKPVNTPRVESTLEVARTAR
jgi:hypothetical protein